MKKKLIIKFVSLVMLLAFIITSLCMIVNQVKDLRCNGVEVFFKEKQQYISGKSIENLVYNSVNGLKGRKLNDLNTDPIEKKIEKNPWVEDAEVYVGFEKADSKFFKGGLKVKIDQRDPYYRVIASKGGYYVDKYGSKMPFSILSTKNVLAVSGNVSSEIAKNELPQLLDFIYDDKYLRSLIVQIHIKRNKEVLLVPRVGKHIIEFGKIEDIERKFKHLYALYTEGFVGEDWSRYKKVSLKFNNQIVCTKR